jgi:hypothetical protein
MYICTVNYSERGSAKGGPPLNLSPSSDRESELLHSNQNDARAMMHQCLKGSCNEP